MTHKLKALGLALVAVFAMSAVVAQAAQAGEFQSEKGNKVTVTGEQIPGIITGNEVKKHEFSTVAGTVKCNTAKFMNEAAAESGTKELTLTPTYEGCTFAGLAATVDFASSGCDYLFTAGETVEPGNSDAIHVETHLKCSKGTETVHVNVVGTKCEITIPPQTVSGITAENTTSAKPHDVDAYIDVTGIKYEFHNAKECPNNPEETKLYENGTYKGVATLKGDIFGTETAEGLTVT